MREGQRQKDAHEYGEKFQKEVQEGGSASKGEHGTVAIVVVR